MLCADGWIRTADLWYQKQPLCQLSHNHWPSEICLWHQFQQSLHESLNLCHPKISLEAFCPSLLVFGMIFYYERLFEVEIQFWWPHVRALPKRNLEAKLNLCWQWNLGFLTFLWWLQKEKRLVNEIGIFGSNNWFSFLAKFSFDFVTLGSFWTKRLIKNWVSPKLYF